MRAHRRNAFDFRGNLSSTAAVVKLEQNSIAGANSILSMDRQAFRMAEQGIGNSGNAAPAIAICAANYRSTPGFAIQPIPMANIRNPAQDYGKYARFLHALGL